MTNQPPKTHSEGQTNDFHHKLDIIIIIFYVCFICWYSLHSFHSSVCVRFVSIFCTFATANTLSSLKSQCDMCLLGAFSSPRIPNILSNCLITNILMGCLGPVNERTFMYLRGFMFTIESHRSSSLNLRFSPKQKKNNEATTMTVSFINPKYLLLLSRTRSVEWLQSHNFNANQHTFTWLTSSGHWYFWLYFRRDSHSWNK